MLSVGRFVEKKGIRNVILAMKTLVKIYPEIQYRIIGSGVLENDLKTLTNSLDLERNIHFLGNTDDDSQIEEFGRATIFILPCLEAKNGDMDGIPVSLMDAMYSRVPVISTTISGIPELIQHGKEGLLVEPGNIDQLVNAIKALIEDKKLRIDMGERGREKITSEFNIHEEVRKMVGIWGAARVVQIHTRPLSGDLSQMKIAVVVPFVYPFEVGGAQVHAYYLAKALSKKNNVTVLSKGTKRINQKIDEASFVLVGSPDKYFVGSVITFFNYFRELSKHQPKVIIVDFLTGGVSEFAVVLTSVLRRIPYVVTIHGHEIKKNDMFSKLVQRIVLFFAKRIFVVSNDLCNAMIKNFQISNEKIVIVPNGYDREEIERAKTKIKKREDE